MSSKKAFKQDSRGGRRENAGRKPIWRNKDPITIRVPKSIASQVLELAHKLDSVEKIELNTKSKIVDNDANLRSKLTENEIITNSDGSSQEKKSDFKSITKAEKTEKITESKTTSEPPKNEIITNSNLTKHEAIKIAKKILKYKKSARISLAKLISKLYSQIVSPEDLSKDSGV